MKLKEIFKIKDKEFYHDRLRTDYSAIGYNQAIDEIGSMNLVMDREKLIGHLKKQEVGLIVKGYYNGHLWDEKFGEIAESIITALPTLLTLEADTKGEV